MRHKQPEAILDIRDVAKRLDVNVRTIMRWLSDGQFPGAYKKNPYKLRSPWQFPLSVVEQFERDRIAARPLPEKKRRAQPKD